MHIHCRNEAEVSLPHSSLPTATTWIYNHIITMELNMSPLFEQLHTNESRLAFIEPRAVGK